MNNKTKITSDHLRRNAYVYVRQSTEYQVQNNLESKQRQYALADIAKGLGWSSDSVIVIDEDLGRSGSSTLNRTGFAKLVAEVALRKAGMVFGLEVSRIARNNKDWYQLLDLCSMNATLIADADGIYDPSNFNDRLLLGLKGTMSEAELHVLKSRMLAGLQNKAKRGELRFHLPPGYEFDDENRIVKTTDEQILHMINLIFIKIFEIGSVNGVMKLLLEEGLFFPRKASFDKTPRWVTPYYKAIYDTLTNPIYAGVYVFGKTKIIKEFDENGNQKSRQKKQDMKDWEVVIQDHHSAFVTWEKFLQIRKMIKQNQSTDHGEARRVTREGSALLQGLARCGKCGRGMQISYHGKGDVSYPYYVCRSAVIFGGKFCQSVGGRRIDETVTNVFLHEMSLSALGIHLEALRSIHENHDLVAEQLELDIERAQYDADRIKRQYDAVEPENRLVARSLEKQWNEALRNLEVVKEQLEARKRKGNLRLTLVEEDHIKSLVQDLPAVWGANSTSDKDKKFLFRTIIEEVQILKEDRNVNLKIVWKGGAITKKCVLLPKIGALPAERQDLIDLIGKLATKHTDKQIARILIRKRLKTPQGLSFNAHRVANLRLRHKIECYQKSSDRHEQTYTVEQAAKIFGVSAPTIYNWLSMGILKGDQITSGAPWSIYINEDDRKLLIEETSEGWLGIEEAARHCSVSKQTVLNWVKERKVNYVYVTKGRRRGLRIEINSKTYTRQVCLFS
ncbi:MAG: recombinase family protein [Chlamydiae bacterium]|nr:recombinase family protein [Chlamydiota bacterium]